MNQIIFSDIKSKARLQMKGNILTYLLVSLVLAVIISVSVSTGIGPLLLGGPVELGTAFLALEIARNATCQFDTAFKGFRQFGSAFVASFLGSVYIFLWSCLFIIPGIIAAYRYSMTFYILADNPNMSGTDALKASKQMMQGHKWEFFMLQFSFIGWCLLSVLTCGILLIWLIPYIETANALYYEELKFNFSPNFSNETEYEHSDETNYDFFDDEDEEEDDDDEEEES